MFEFTTKLYGLNVTVSATMCDAEPDVGIMEPYAEIESVTCRGETMQPADEDYDVLSIEAMERFTEELKSSQEALAEQQFEDQRDGI